MAISDHHKAACEYASAPICDPAAFPAWSALARETGRLYAWVLKQGLEIQRVHGGPYTSFESLCSDIKRGRLRSTIDFDPHPVWDLDTLVKWRVVHDYCHYVTGLDFTVEGEWDLCLHHFRTIDEAAWPAIVAEIYGQAAYSVVFGEYAKPKVFLSTLKPEGVIYQ